MNILDLPLELLLNILRHALPPWSANMSLTCELDQIPNISVLRTCRSFHTHGTPILQSSFTGEFIRHDRRGCITKTDLEPLRWYAWIMAHTRILHLYDAYFTIWYIPQYWECYPMLQGFVVSLLPERTYNDPRLEMPHYIARATQCQVRTTKFAGAYYAFHGYLFDEVFVRVWKDVLKHRRESIVWPTVEYRFWDCRCHPWRQTVFKLQHTNVPKEVDDFIDEAFCTEAYHVEGGESKLLHEATLHCVALPTEHGFAKGLRAVAVLTRPNGKDSMPVEQ